MEEHTQPILNQINQAIHSGNFQLALNLCREHWKSHSTNPYFKVAYARSVYYLYLKSPDISDLNKTLKSVNAVFELAPPPSLLAFYSLRAIIKSSDSTRIFKLILQYHPNIICPRTVMLFCNARHPNLNPEDNVLKNLTLLYQVSKVLHQIEKFDWAFEIASYIIQHFPNNVHDTHNIRFWSMRIKLLSEFILNPAEAIANEFKNLILKKKDWFLFHEAAKMYVQLNMFTEAVHLLFHAVADIKNPEKDVPLRYKALLLLFHAIEKLNANSKLYDPSSLAVTLMTWFSASNLSDKTHDTFKKYAHLNNKINLPSSNDFISEIRNAAKAFKITLPAALELPLCGLIHSWFPDKGYGFVEYNKQTYFFNKIDHLPNANLIKKNIPCEFKLTNSFDKKKNKPSQKAVLVKLLTDH